MQRKTVWRWSRVAMPIIIACSLLAAASSARAEDEDGKCTNATLRGDYGFTIEGIVALPGGTLANGAPLRGVALATL